jgi:Spy/CpxP family protein refolding chaperone
MNWLKKLFSNAATQTILAAAMGGAVVAVGDAASTAASNHQPIDWSHVHSTAIAGAIVGIAGLWKSKPGGNPPTGPTGVVAQ